MYPWYFYRFLTLSKTFVLEQRKYRGIKLKHVKLHQPLVLISIFLLLFVYLRFFFVIYDWSGIVEADNKYVIPTIQFYLFLHIGFGLLYFLISGLHWKKNLRFDGSTLPIVKLYFWIGIVCLALHSLITLKNYGTLGWFVPSKIDIWASLSILQIPINFIQIIVIHFIYNAKSKKQRIQLSLILLLNVNQNFWV